MENEKLYYFRERLLEEKRRIEEEIHHSNRFNLDQALTDSTKELSAYDNHPADLGSETFEREKDLALWDNAHEIYQRVLEALEYLEKGGYGICEHCGKEIGSDRLEAIPYTTLCVDCQRLTEDQFVNRERPVEEEVLAPPFGRTFLDGTDNVAFDGEDAWQAVARYGTSETPSDLGGTLDYEDTYYDAGEPQGVVEKVDGIIDLPIDQIPPDPEDEGF